MKGTIEKKEHRFLLRIENELWDYIKSLTKKSRRSANDEINHVIDLHKTTKNGNKSIR